MNFPNRPVFTTIGLLHFSHFSSVVNSTFGTILMVPSSSFSKFCVFLQGGLSLYAGQARNFPLRPHLISIIRPHFPQGISVGGSTVSLGPGFVFYSLRSVVKGPYNYRIVL